MSVYLFTPSQIKNNYNDRKKMEIFDRINQEESKIYGSIYTSTLS